LDALEDVLFVHGVLLPETMDTRQRSHPVPP
jgi:hypothetical protein